MPPDMAREPGDSWAKRRQHEVLLQDLEALRRHAHRRVAQTELGSGPEPEALVEGRIAEQNDGNLTPPASLGKTREDQGRGNALPLAVGHDADRREREDRR